MIRVDTHQHFWNLDEVAYPWLTPDLGPIYRNFDADELAPQLAAAGVEHTVIVQAMNSYADTDSMLAIAAAYDWVAGVVGWLPIHDPAETARKLDEYGQQPLFQRRQAPDPRRAQPRLGRAEASDRRPATPGGCRADL